MGTSADDGEDFKDVLVRLMADRHLSQSAIARAADVDRSRVSEWKRGLGYPSPRSLERLAEEFGLDLPRLQFLCKYRGIAPSAGNSPDELEILALYRKVAAEHKPAATSMLRGLAVATMHAKSRISDVAKSRNARLNGQSDQDEPGAHKSLRDCYGLRSLGRGALAVAAL